MVVPKTKAPGVCAPLGACHSRPVTTQNPSGPKKRTTEWVCEELRVPKAAGSGGLHRKKGAESERPQAYTFEVELGVFTEFFPGFHFQSDSPDDAWPLLMHLALFGATRQSRRV